MTFTDMYLDSRTETTLDLECGGRVVITLATEAEAVTFGMMANLIATRLRTHGRWATSR
jgi:hypothetical protein